MSNEVKYLITTGSFSSIAFAITMCDFLEAFQKGFILFWLLVATIIIINSNKGDDANV